MWALPRAPTTPLLSDHRNRSGGITVHSRSSRSALLFRWRRRVEEVGGGVCSVGLEDVLGDEAAEVGGQQRVMSGGEAREAVQDVTCDGRTGRGAAEHRERVRNHLRDPINSLSARGRDAS
jgi:hypothetical protein